MIFHPLPLQNVQPSGGYDFQIVVKMAPIIAPFLIENVKMVQ